jgi:hypothetical protein
MPYTSRDVLRVQYFKSIFYQQYFITWKMLAAYFHAITQKTGSEMKTYAGIPILISIPIIAQPVHCIFYCIAAFHLLRPEEHLTRGILKGRKKNRELHNLRIKNTSYFPTVSKNLVTDQTQQERTYQTCRLSLSLTHLSFSVRHRTLRWEHTIDRFFRRSPW